jgi:hypothetical protein
MLACSTAIVLTSIISSNAMIDKRAVAAAAPGVALVRPAPVRTPGRRPSVYETESGETEQLTTGEVFVNLSGPIGVHSIERLKVIPSRSRILEPPRYQ